MSNNYQEIINDFKSHNTYSEDKKERGQRQRQLPLIQEFDFPPTADSFYSSLELRRS